MIYTEPPTKTTEIFREKPSELTGLTCKVEQAVTAKQASSKPVSAQWITDELLAETMGLWSQSYGREVCYDEAMEILMNVKAMAEYFLAIQQKTGKEARQK